MGSAAVRKPLAVVFIAALGAFLATFNETYFNVALVPVMTSLSVDASTVQWLSTAYMLVAAIFVPVTGFLYRSVPTKVLYSAALGFLLVGSAVGFFAQSFPVLLLARVIQAAGTGMIPPIAMNMTLAAAPKGRLGSYLGIVGAMTTLGPSTSPLVAGVVLTVAPWEFLFAVYAVLVAICLAVVLVALRGSLAELTHPALDVPSVALVSVALVGLMFAVSTVFSGSVAVAAASFVVGAAALAAFLVRQGRIPDPLINLTPFKNRAFSVGSALVVLALMSVFAMNMIMPLFMQAALGFTALASAISLFPAVVCACGFSPLAGRLYDRFGARVLLPFGMLLVAVFDVVLACAAFAAGANLPALVLALLYAPVVIGASLVIGPAQSFALSRLDRAVNSHGVTIMSTGFQVAGCVGSSVFMGVYSVGQARALAGGAAAAVASTEGFLFAAGIGVVIAVVGVAAGVVAGVLERREVPTGVLAQTPARRSAVEVLSAVMKHDVFSVRDSQSVFDALSCMMENRTSGLPVLTAEGRLAGFISEGDIVRFVAGEEAESPSYTMYALWNDGRSFQEKMDDLKQLDVMELASPAAVSVELSDGIDAASKLLSRHHLKKLPVTERGQVVGTISRSDLVRYFFRESAEAPMPAAA